MLKLPATFPSVQGTETVIGVRYNIPNLEPFVLYPFVLPQWHTLAFHAAYTVLISPILNQVIPKS